MHRARAVTRDGDSKKGKRGGRGADLFSECLSYVQAMVSCTALYYAIFVP